MLNHNRFIAQRHDIGWRLGRLPQRQELSGRTLAPRRDSFIMML
jgi:uncharacterized protein (DUF924 family)